MLIGYLDGKLLQMVEAGVQLTHQQPKLGGVLSVRLLATLATRYGQQHYITSIIGK